MCLPGVLRVRLCFQNGSDLESGVFMCVGLLGVLFVFVRLWVSVCVSVCLSVCVCVCVRLARFMFPTCVSLLFLFVFLFFTVVIRDFFLFFFS